MGASNDELVHVSHVEKLYEAYSGVKELLITKGTHNSERPEFLLAHASSFLVNLLV